VYVLYGIGIDIGASYTRVALADEKGTILEKIAEPTIKTGEGTNLTMQIIAMIKKILTIHNVRSKDLAGIGIGSIGPLDLKRGFILKTPNLPFEKVPLRDPLEREFGVDVKILNDCTAAVVGEKFIGAGKNVDNLVYVTISTGIGGGAYVDGHLLIGKNGNAVEIGHMIVDPEGLLICGCGKPGHWEAYCSGSNIPRYAKFLLNRMGNWQSSLIYEMTNGDLGKLNAKIVYDAARKNDKIATAIVEKITRFNIIGIANTIEAYDPELLTIGGSVALKNVDLVIEPLVQEVKKHVMIEPPEIKATPLGDEVVLYGAIALSIGLGP